MQLRTVRAFRHGWATNLGAKHSHVYDRHELGPAVAQCGGDIALAGDLYALDTLHARCPGCELIERERAVEAGLVAPPDRCISNRRIAQWDRRIAALKAYVTRTEMRDPIRYDRIKRAEAFIAIAATLAQRELRGEIRHKQWAYEAPRAAPANPFPAFTATASFNPSLTQAT